VKKHVGSCHCGAVRFAIEMDEKAAPSRCNCTICTKIGAIGCIVRPPAFELRAGEGSLGVYEWGGKVARRHFCKTCGVFCFSRGHLDVLGGDFVGVNLNTLDDLDPSQLKVVHWDGRHDNWQAGPRDTPWPIEA
jgi:hypothetical protein